MSGYVLDDTVLHSLAFGDPTAVSAVLSLAAGDNRISVPAIALVTAAAELSATQSAELGGMIDNNRTIQLHTIDTTFDAATCAAVLGELGADRDLSAAHTAAVARHLDWPIITTDRSRWLVPAKHLPWRVELVDIADPPE